MNCKLLIKFSLLSLFCLSSVGVEAQSVNKISEKGISSPLSANPNKFLGNITTSGRVNPHGLEYASMWNQLTAENESKWGSVEGAARGKFNWQGSDNAYRYCKDHGIPFKFHCLIWGAQYPRWMDSLSVDEQRAAIEEWMDAIKERYPDQPMIDVVNEAVKGHQPAPFREALGGEGKTGFDWIIRAFEMAHERWPDAILIYNDYNTFRWQKNEFIQLVSTLRDAGAPIDAYGCQSHELTDMPFDEFRQAMTDIQSALRMPMYSTEYDIGTESDSLQLAQYQQQIPFMWQQDYCAGITLWGYVYGRTWTRDGNSGIIRDGKERPALTWLRQYMRSAEAQQARSPFPAMRKEASLYIKPSALSVACGQSVTVDINARLRTKTIDHIYLYMVSVRLFTLTRAPFTVQVKPATAGRHELRAVLTATDGSSYERYGLLLAN